MQSENFRVILSYILKNVFLPSFFFELDKLKKCRFCTTFKNMCQWRREDEKQREEMTCITKKYPMKEQFIELGRRLFCVCHVKWRKTFCFDHKRVERKAGKECCEWESKFNKHRQTYQFNWIKFNNYSWWCYQKESSPFFLSTMYDSSILMRKSIKQKYYESKLSTLTWCWVLKVNESKKKHFHSELPPHSHKKICSLFIGSRISMCGYERAADDDDDGEFISDISDTICIFKWLSLSTNHKILLIMSL